MIIFTTMKTSRQKYSEVGKIIYFWPLKDRYQKLVKINENAVEFCRKNNLFAEIFHNKNAKLIKKNFLNKVK